MTRRAAVIWIIFLLLAFLILLAMVLTGSASAQEDVLPLFGSVQPARVTVATAVIDNGANQREHEGLQAQDTARLVKQFAGQFVGSDTIQKWTWDFETWQPREYTPLVLMVTVMEKWDVVEVRAGAQVTIQYIHITGIACYDVRDPSVFACRQWQGSAYYEMRYHCNSVLVSHADVGQITEGLGL